MFFLSQVAVPYLSDNDTIINTTSVTAYRGSGHLIDYASTKGAIASFTRSQPIIEKIFEQYGTWSNLYTTHSGYFFEEAENQGGNTTTGTTKENLRLCIFATNG